MVRIFAAEMFSALWLVFTKPAVVSATPRTSHRLSDEPVRQGSQPPPQLPKSVATSDEQLMVAHRSGDPEAFAQLYRRYSQPLLRLMVRQQRYKEEALDLVQQTFLQVHRARGDYDPTRRFRPWLYAIALNLSREALRKRQRGPTFWHESAGLAEAVANGVAPEQVQVIRAVRAAIEALPSGQREVIELHWFDGLTFPEIGQCLGVPTNTAKVRAHRGYQGLRARLDDVMPNVVTDVTGAIALEGAARRSRA